MTPKRLWLNKIPTLCDVVIEFPGKLLKKKIRESLTENDNEFLEHAPDEALRWLLSRIRSQPPAGLGLQANVKAHESSKRTAFYISSPCNMCVIISVVSSVHVHNHVHCLKLDYTKQPKRLGFQRDYEPIWVEL